MDSTKQTLVIARYNEDVSWSNKYKRIIIQKDEDVPNIGREITSFLYFIVTNYGKIEGDYVFCQGTPFDHAPNILKGEYGTTYTCNANGNPHHPGLDIHAVCRELDLPILEEYTFTPGGQFKVSAETIKKRPWEWYVKAMYLSTQGKNPWIFERLWNYIFI